ncbi:hypothetical protein JOQ06_008521 [Pogonophryne albipinna]|uniref:Uncharacterized protein n=1 Tax=Pogonophryne albipinna TaxID=1090488 RepID=A0AAD6AKJ5_9TELE|nr:hypothetical protein JOQ06_008521 [Pogonophryne albipinna]
MRGIRSVLFFMFLALLLLQSRSFELQDTIHALIQENIHLHDQLENLTQALRELKRMLWHHSNDPDHHEHHEFHSEDTQHMWDEWSEHAINAETHLFLEHAFCGHELHHSAAGLQAETSVRLLALPGLILLLLLLRDL